MSEQEAITRAEFDNKSAPRKHCPLIDRKCIKDCVCWQEAKPYEVKVSLDGAGHKGCGQYKVSWVGCNNMMFFRECNIQY